MYVKIFTKILDSSIWLEAHTTRIVWFTLLAQMDQEGFAAFASPANLAYRARVTLEECTAALTVLEGPDPNSGDPDNEGRRLERMPGGWLVLNAMKYKEIATREHQLEANRGRVRRHRAKRSGNAPVTDGNATVTKSNTAEADAETEAKQTTTTTQPPQPDPIFDGMQEAPPARPAPRPLPVRDDWFQWRLSHPRIFIAGTGGDGTVDDWRALLEECGADCLNAVYDRLTAQLAQNKRLFYSAAATYVAANTKPTGT